MTKVALRSKEISGQRQALYLDFYPPVPHPETGKPTRREFLKLYVYEKPKTTTERQENKERQALAENIRARRQLDIERGEFGFLSDTKSKADFVQYFRELADKRKGSNADNWISTLKYLEKFTGGNLCFTNLTENFCNDFREYLFTSRKNTMTKEKLAQNSVFSYFNKFKAALKQAYKDGYLDKDINRNIDGVKPAETNRLFLTIEELNKLVKTDCPIPMLKQAALFSAMTGLRFCDIKKMDWGEIQESKEQGIFIQFIQQKTKGAEMLPISDQAYSLLGERKAQKEPVFSGLIYSAYLNLQLSKWLLKAGITKDITFHCFRHTYATLLLSKGEHISTIQKMLGHKHLKTTQVYAKVIDSMKREAANKIVLDF